MLTYEHMCEYLTKDDTLGFSLIGQVVGLLRQRFLLTFR